MPNKSTRFQSKSDEEKMVRRQVHIRPDQDVALERFTNRSEVMRAALDMYLSIHPPTSNGVDYAVVLAAMAADDSEE
jgi:hypothetical protein